MLFRLPTATMALGQGSRDMPHHIPHRSPQSGAITAGQIGLIIILISVITAGALLLTDNWPFGEDPVPAPQPVAEVEVVPPVAVEPAAEPVPEPQSEPPAEPRPKTVPLPRLDESDDAVRDAIADIPLGTAGQQYLLAGNIIERSTSVIYLMAEGEVPYKLLPIARPKTAFPITDDGLQVTADPAGYARYHALAKWVESLDVEALLSALDWFLPLFREAWSFYGADESYFDRAVLNTLDLIIYTPEVDVSEARLFLKEAVWLYEDPTIEGLAPIQKQVLRLGPANAIIVKDKAGEARSLWAARLAAAG